MNTGGGRYWNGAGPVCAGTENAAIKHFFVEANEKACTDQKCQMDGA